MKKVLHYVANEATNNVRTETLDTLLEEAVLCLESNEMELQSEVANLDVVINQNVEFTNADPVALLTFAPVSDETFVEDMQETMTLDDILKRPINILTYEWVEPAFPDTTFNPLELILDNPLVTQKMTNFGYLKGSIKLRFIVNGSPFYYGSMLAAYHPLPNFSPDSVATISKVCWSQRPHVWLNPNSRAELTLPFFYYKNYVDITNREEVQNFGKIDLVEYESLKTANSVSLNGCTIQVYAWLEDIVLTGGTSKMILQADDEYGNSPISAPASAIATMSQKLSNVPMIGNYARATEIGASAVSNIAKLFGYTNVPVIEDVKPLKSTVFGGLSSGFISEPIDKFTLDPKAELTIDPSTTGLGSTDELAISSIIQRESYLGRAVWATENAVDDILFNTLVCPSLREISGGSQPWEICFTPMAHIAQLFNNWRGDIIFRFRFIHSCYHKGRFRVSWDPLGDIVTNKNTNNIVLTKIVDLSENITNVSIRVPYMQAKVWLQTRSVFLPNHEKDWQVADKPLTTVFADQTNGEVGNGTLTVRVLNKLSAPQDAADIALQVFVKAADNLEFANPIDLSKGFSHFEVQTEVENMPTDVQEMGSVGNLSATRYLLNYGESIASVRSLMRRHNLCDIIPLQSLGAGNNQAYVIVQYLMNKYPIPPGFNPDVDTVASTGIFTSAPFSFSNMTPFNWMQGAFIGCRGSMNWKFNFNADGSSPVESIRTTRVLNELVSPVLALDGVDTGLNLNEYSSWYWDRTIPGSSGISLTNQRTQTALAFQCPQMNQNRFVSCSPFKTTKGYAVDNSDRETYRVQFQFANNGRNDITGTLIERYSAIGTDFNFFFYLNAPITYFTDQPIVPN